MPWSAATAPHYSLSPIVLAIGTLTTGSNREILVVLHKQAQIPTRDQVTSMEAMGFETDVPRSKLTQDFRPV